MLNLKKNKQRIIAGLTLSLGLFSASTLAANQCETVRFSDVGWSDIAVTTAVASEIVQGLGYQSDVQMLGVPVTFSSMASGDIDVFLGNWMPTMKGDIAKYVNNGSVEVVGANLTGAKYTLAVPKYVYDAGVHSFADIAKFKDKFRGRIYGIEAGNDGNRLIQSMIDENDFGLKGFRLVESSEAGMISQVSRAIRRNQWVAFLGWEPHPMNSNFDIEYLTGGDDYFGPNYGGASVFTNVRKGYINTCPNVGQLLKNLQFTLKMENELMDKTLNQGQKPAQAAKAWLANHPKVLEKWLQNVDTIDGKNGLKAVKQYVAL